MNTFSKLTNNTTVKCINNITIFGPLKQTNMAVPANFACPDREKSNYCFSKLINFKYKDDESSKTDLNLLLDQLNSLEYATVVVSEQVGNEMLNIFLWLFVQRHKIAPTSLDSKDNSNCIYTVIE